MWAACCVGFHVSSPLCLLSKEKQRVDPVNRKPHHLFSPSYPSLTLFSQGNPFLLTTQQTNNNNNCLLPIIVIINIIIVFIVNMIIILPRLCLLNHLTFLFFKPTSIIHSSSRQTYFFLGSPTKSIQLNMYTLK